jgi:hypothetical protein
MSSDLPYEQLAVEHLVVVQLLQLTTPPLQFWQHRYFVPLCWQYGGVQA